MSVLPGFRCACAYWIDLCRLPGRTDAFYRLMETHYLRIKHWDNLYENSRSRCIDKVRWVLIPNKHDGLGYARIMNEKDGLEIFACWIILLQVASKCKPRGVLCDDDGFPLDAMGIMLKARIPAKKEKVMKRAIEFILYLKWMQRVKVKDADQLPDEGHECTPELNRIEENRIESDTIVSGSSEPEKLSQSKRIKWSIDSGWIDIIDEDIQQWSEAAPACDIKRELAAMHAWLTANPKKAKKSNYARFITTWLSRSQDRGGGLKSAQGSGREYGGYTKANQNAGTDYSKAYVNKPPK